MPYLLKDFDDRCAYSMVHILEIGRFDVDHFNPTLKKPYRDTYSNYLPALSHCNGKKHDNWPSSKLIARGIGFINPARETDYGLHIFEDPVTHLLVGTARGRYQIVMCDLNAPFLVERRKDRAYFKKIFESKGARYRRGFQPHEVDCLLDDLAHMRTLVDRGIPEIPPPPPDRTDIWPPPAIARVQR